MFAAVLVLSIVCGLLVGRDVVRWAFKKNTKVEARRRAASHLAATLSAYGLKRLPEMLGDYAVGDYSGVADKFHDFAKLVMTPGGEAAVVNEFEGVFANVLAKKMASEEGRALLVAKLNDKPTDAAVEAKAAPAATKVSA